VSGNRDQVDELIDQWRAVRPDLAGDLDAMATIGRLGRLHTFVRGRIDQVLGEHGLTVGEFDVLSALRRAGEPFVLRPIDLARSLMLSPAGMTNRLDRLEAADHIVRRADPEDRRSMLVVLTDSGRELVDTSVAEHVANEARLMSPLTTAQRRSFDQALRVLLAQFDPPPPAAAADLRL
jgi:DNA-binding MarR family transcriptional regulator